MEARSGQQPVFAARPKLQADFGDVVGWLEAKPGKRLVVSGSLSCHGHHALEARTIHSRQILPHHRVIDHSCHARNAIGQRSLDPIGRVALVHLA
jgi:hypothetical protein